MNKELLVHIRNYYHTPDHKLEINSRGGATFYCVPNPEGGYSIQIALCSDKDVFCRKIGHSIAKGRYELYGGIAELTGKLEILAMLTHAAQKVGDVRGYNFWEKLVNKFVEQVEGTTNVVPKNT